MSSLVTFASNAIFFFDIKDTNPHDAFTWMQLERPGLGVVNTGYGNLMETMSCKRGPPNECKSTAELCHGTFLFLDELCTLLYFFIYTVMGGVLCSVAVKKLPNVGTNPGCHRLP